jgi:hypothetical protein
MLLLIVMAGAALLAQAPPPRADIVMVSGCLKEQPAGTWRVVNALEPKPSNAVAPPASELPAMPVVGTREFQLIGVSIFDLPSYRNQTVVVKGLLIPASPVSRLNMTSIVRVAPSCAPGK